MIKGYASKLYGYEIGHAPANLATQRILSEKHSTCVFRKYRRAQITLFHIHTASVALALNFYSSSFRRLATCTGGLLQPHTVLFASIIDFTVLHFTGLSQVSGSDYPIFRPILPKILYYFDFTAPFFILPIQDDFALRDIKGVVKQKNSVYA